MCLSPPPPRSKNEWFSSRFPCNKCRKTNQKRGYQPNNSTHSNGGQKNQELRRGDLPKSPLLGGSNMRSPGYWRETWAVAMRAGEGRGEGGTADGAGNSDSRRPAEDHVPPQLRVDQEARLRFDPSHPTQTWKDPKNKHHPLWMHESSSHHLSKPGF